MLPPPVLETKRLAVSPSGRSWGARVVPEETAIALTYNQAAYAVMMATPADLEDFGVGFSLNEGVARVRADILDLQVVPNELGIEIRMTLTDAAAERTVERRRRLAGPVGCGLCGVESLAEAMRSLPTVSALLPIDCGDVLAAASSLAKAQDLNRSTRAVHAAGFWRRDDGLLAAREDVGRHNALDKLAGALAQSAEPANEGVIVISSRVSVEMVQKAVLMGAPVLIAVSAPTALAVRTAQATGLTLIAVARDDGFEVFTSPERLRP